MKVDSKVIKLPPDLSGIMLLNINSYAGGADLWGKDDNSLDSFDHKKNSFSKPSLNDGMLEIVGVTGSFHMGACTINMSSAIRIAQGSSVSLYVKSNEGMPMQMDGEPWLQPSPFAVHFRCNRKANMLVKPISNETIFDLFKSGNGKNNNNDNNNYKKKEENDQVSVVVNNENVNVNVNVNTNTNEIGNGANKHVDPITSVISNVQKVFDFDFTNIFTNSNDNVSNNNNNNNDNNSENNVQNDFSFSNRTTNTKNNVNKRKLNNNNNDSDTNDDNNDKNK